MASSGCLWLQNPVTRMGSSGLGSPMEMFQHAPVVCRSIAANFIVSSNLPYSLAFCCQ